MALEWWFSRGNYLLNKKITFLIQASEWVNYYKSSNLYIVQYIHTYSSNSNKNITMIISISEFKYVNLYLYHSISFYIFIYNLQCKLYHDNHIINHALPRLFVICKSQVLPVGRLVIGTRAVSPSLWAARIARIIGWSSREQNGAGI